MLTNYQAETISLFGLTECATRITWSDVFFSAVFLTFVFLMWVFR